MMRELYFKIPRKIRLFALFLIVLFFAYFVGRFMLAKSKTVPQSFISSRQDASAMAGEIVGLSRESAGRIAEIRELNRQEKYTEALDLVQSELERNRQIRDKAIHLSESLQRMTASVSGIAPRAAAEDALEAVSTEVTLIGHLLTYNDYLNQLLEMIRSRITGSDTVSTEDVIDITKKINDEAIVVNVLNQKFNDKMTVFDRGF